MDEMSRIDIQPDEPTLLGLGLLGFSKGDMKKFGSSGWIFAP